MLLGSYLVKQGFCCLQPVGKDEKLQVLPGDVHAAFLREGVEVPVGKGVCLLVLVPGDPVCVEQDPP